MNKANNPQNISFVHSDAENQAPPSDIEECQELFNKEQANIAQLRLQIAKKNRQIVVIHRQLDNIPDRAELAQYQRRFIELYNQGECCHSFQILKSSPPPSQYRLNIEKQSSFTLCTTYWMTQNVTWRKNLIY